MANDFFISNAALLEITCKLLIATVLSLIIRLERELKKKPVGLKTSLVIATFSCLLTIISIETAYSTSPRDDINITMDPLRLAAQVVSGIGFLGAGVILRRGNDSITGLTTAAMIWGAAGIGIAVGAGFYIYAILTVAIVVIGVEVIAPFLLKVGPKQLRMKEVSIIISLDRQANISKVLQEITSRQLTIEHLKIVDCDAPNFSLTHEIHLRCLTSREFQTLTLYTALQQLDDIQKIEIELIH